MPEKGNQDGNNSGFLTEYKQDVNGVTFCVEYKKYLQLAKLTKTCTNTFVIVLTTSNITFNIGYTPITENNILTGYTYKVSPNWNIEK